MLRRFKEVHTLIWGYSVEFLATALIWLLIELRLGIVATRLIYLKKTDLFVLMGIAAGICGVFFAAFIAAMCVEFGQKLRRIGAANDYFVALTIPFLALGAASIAVNFVDSDASTTVSKIALLLIIYATLNCVTIIRNVWGLYKLWQDLDQARNV